ncbi:MAG TPA: ABC transporter substrate-binding protein [Candidatus Acidoferrales bacterium]|nr:ABC transporter substrate-binding protein [Candidatus Acidoferrales bacterium]
MGIRANCRSIPFLLGISLALTLVNCQSRKAEPPGTITFLIESMPTNLDPRVGTDAFSAHLDGMIFSSLVGRDDRMNMVPDLATSWEIPDPLTYIFHLRHGVKFHDGRAFTAADAKFTFESIMNGTVKTAKRGSFRMVASIDAPDDYTLVFHLKEPYASFLWDLTRPGVGIVPAGSGSEMSRHPIGTGPFRFVSMATDEEIVLARNDDYYGYAAAKAAPPYEASAVGATSAEGAASAPGASRAGDAPTGSPIERIRFRIVPDALTRALELRKGSADGEVNSLTPDMVSSLSHERGLELTDQPGTVLAYIAINFNDPILAHREVRQALAYATDRETLIKYLFRGEARPASSLLPPNHWAYEPNVTQYNYDPERAEQLLDAAGYRRGADGVRFHVTLKTSTEESTRLLAEALADEWRRVGIALDLRSLEFATFYSDISHGSFQLYTYRWIGGNNDPDIFDYVFNSAKMPPNGANRGHYHNPMVDALLDRERVEMDQAKRKVILSNIQKIVAEDEPYINLWYMDNESIHRARLTNVVLPAGGDYEFLGSARLQ